MCMDTFPHPQCYSLTSHLIGDMWDRWRGYLSKWKMTKMFKICIQSYFTPSSYSTYSSSRHLIMHLCTCSVHQFTLCDIVCPYTHSANLWSFNTDFPLSHHPPFSPTLNGYTHPFLCFMCLINPHNPTKPSSGLKRPLILISMSLVAPIPTTSLPPSFFFYTPWSVASVLFFLLHLLLSYSVPPTSRPPLPPSLSLTQCSVLGSHWRCCSSVAESLCALRCLQCIPSTRAHNQVLPLSS